MSLYLWVKEDMDQVFVAVREAGLSWLEAAEMKRDTSSRDIAAAINNWKIKFELDLLFMFSLSKH